MATYKIKVRRVVTFEFEVEVEAVSDRSAKRKALDKAYERGDVHADSASYKKDRVSEIVKVGD